MRLGGQVHASQQFALKYSSFKKSISKVRLFIYAFFISDIYSYSNLFSS